MHTSIQQQYMQRELSSTIIDSGQLDLGHYIYIYILYHRVGRLYK